MLAAERSLRRRGDANLGVTFSGSVLDLTLLTLVLAVAVAGGRPSLGSDGNWLVQGRRIGDGTRAVGGADASFRGKSLDADEYTVIENTVASRKLAAGKVRRSRMFLISNQALARRAADCARR